MFYIEQGDFKSLEFSPAIWCLRIALYIHTHTPSEKYFPNSGECTGHLVKVFPWTLCLKRVRVGECGIKRKWLQICPKSHAWQITLSRFFLFSGNGRATRKLDRPKTNCPLYNFIERCRLMRSSHHLDSFLSWGNYPFSSILIQWSYRTQRHEKGKTLKPHDNVFKGKIKG